MTITRRRPVRLALLACLALGATLLSAQSVWACEVLDRYGDLRSCTFLEEYGECLWNVMDAHEQCMERKENFLDGFVCHLGTQVDVSVCNLGLPIQFIQKLLNPFEA